MTRSHSPWSTPSGWSTYTRKRDGASELDREDVDTRHVVLDARCDLLLQLVFLLECRRHWACSLLRLWS